MNEQHYTNLPETLLYDSLTVEPIADNPKQLCKRCVEALRRGRYFVRRLDTSLPTRLRTCELCKTRTFVGSYEIGERADKPLRINWRTKRKEQTVSEGTSDEQSTK